jgi:hypothetical protein
MVWFVNNARFSGRYIKKRLFDYTLEAIEGMYRSGVPEEIKMEGSEVNEDSQLDESAQRAEDKSESSTEFTSNETMNRMEMQDTSLRMKDPNESYFDEDEHAKSEAEDSDKQLVGLFENNSNKLISPIQIVNKYYLGVEITKELYWLHNPI